MNKVTKKFLSLIISISLVLSIFPTVGGITVYSAGGTPDTRWYNGTDTEFGIGTADELAGLAELVNGGNQFIGKTIVLTKDIDLSSYGDHWNGGKGWTPIGTMDRSFGGFFNGKNHTISSLSINDNNLEFAGLFGDIDCGTVENLRLIDADVTAKECVGGMAGRVGGTESRLSNCYVTGTVSGDQMVGGIVGSVINPTNSITGCYAAANVSGSSYIGGVAGAVTGASVTYCYTIGSVTGSADYVGGIAGWLDCSFAKGNVMYCLAVNLSVKGASSTTGCIVGMNNNNATLYDNYAFEGMEITVNNQAKFPLGRGGGDVDGADLYANSILKSSNFKLPVNHIFGEVTNPFWRDPYGNDNDFYIYTAAQLAYLAYKVNEGSDDYNGKRYLLMGDIDLSLYGEGWNQGKGWIPIGNPEHPFQGGFNGSNYKITGLYINDAALDDVGVLGNISGGTIKNLGVPDVDITGNSNVGGVAGVINNSGNVVNCYATGVVNGVSGVGGVTGCVGSGTLANCYFAGTAGLAGDDSAGSVNTAVGGVTGVAMGSVENCYATGIVSGRGSVGGVAGEVLHQEGRLTNCYAICDVTGSGCDIGGVAGVVSGGSVERCAALNPSVKGSDFVGRITGSARDALLFGNHAWSGLPTKVASNQEWIDKVPLDIGNAGADGVDVAARDALTTSFWTDTMGWGADIWDMADGRLPTLKTVGGMQRAEIMHITPDAKNNRVVANLISLWQSGSVLIVAVYSDGKLLHVETEPITRGGDMVVNIAMPATADMVQAVMWDGLDTMQPLAPAALSEFLYGTDVRIFVDDTELGNDIPPIIRNGRIMIPWFTIRQVLDASVIWDNGTQSLTVTKDDITNVFYPGIRTTDRNGSTVELEVAPIMADGELYIALRDIAKIYGLKMTFSDELQAVLVYNMPNAPNRAPFAVVEGTGTIDNGQGETVLEATLLRNGEMQSYLTTDDDLNMPLGSVAIPGMSGGAIKNWNIMARPCTGYTEISTTMDAVGRMVAYTGGRVVNVKGSNLDYVSFEKGDSVLYASPFVPHDIDISSVSVKGEVNIYVYDVTRTISSRVTIDQLSCVDVHRATASEANTYDGYVEGQVVYDSFDNDSEVKNVEFFARLENGKVTDLVFFVYDAVKAAI